MNIPQFNEHLFKKYLNNECSEEEVKFLLQYFNDAEGEVELRKLIHQYLASEQHISIPKTMLEEGFQKIKEHIFQADHQKESIVVSISKKNWFRFSVAAALLVFISGITFILINTKGKSSSLVTKEIKLHNDVAPGQNNAVLTLSDGSIIVLDSAADGTLAQQSGANVLKLNGQVAYKNSGEANAEVVYNEITTAKGNQFRLVLSDGSVIWLNAASSIRFPTTFTGKERKVEIRGEAYFEVAKDVLRPFKVMVHSANGGSEVEVLGTHFNINAYDDEPDVKTTLLEGSVKINTNKNTKILSPGQQAVFSSNIFSVRNEVDVDGVVAWKNGFFVFNNTSIKTLMRQVSRWYDVEVKFDGVIEEEGYTGKISRSVPLSKLLKVLELNDIHVRMEGRTIAITP